MERDCAIAHSLSTFERERVIKCGNKRIQKAYMKIEDLIRIEVPPFGLVQRFRAIIYVMIKNGPHFRVNGSGKK